MVKRITALILISSLLIGVLPASALAVTPAATISVSNITSQFDPTMGGQFNMTYQVSNASAEGFFINIYEAVAPTEPGRLCANLPSKRKATIVTPQTKPQGSHTAIWNGIDETTGRNVQEGSYCYAIRWNNGPGGAAGLKEGYLYVSAPGTGTGVTGGGNLSDSSLITVSANKTRIDRAEDESVTLSYTIHQELSTGFSLKIYDGAENEVRNLKTTSVRTAPHSDTKTWNGVDNANRAVVRPGETKNFFYRFKINGITHASGSIQVTDSSPERATLTHYANSSVIDPTARVPGIATIYYTVREVIPGGLTLVIRDGSNRTIKTLSSTNAPILANSYVATWNGLETIRTDGTRVPVPVGTYRYVFISPSTGTELGFGTIGVNYITPSTPTPTTPTPTPDPLLFIVGTPVVIPTSFNPGNRETTAVYYTVGKTVNNFKLSVRNQAGFEVETLVTDAKKTTNNYSAVWDGRDSSDVPFPAGQYTFRFEAAFQTPVSSPAVTVVSTTVAGAPVITDLGPNPTQFTRGGTGTTFRYRVSQDAKVDLTVLQGAVTIRRVLITGVTNNAFTGMTNNVPWDGRKDDGFLADPGIYSYVIEARNNNGVAVPISGVVTILDGGDPTGNLVISNITAAPNPFNPESQNTTVSFTTNLPATISASVLRADGTQVKSLVFNQQLATGTHTLPPWNGTDLNNALVHAGAYTIRIDGYTLNNGSDTEFGTVTVQRDVQPPSGLDIYNVFANPSTFRPESQNTNLTFSLNLNAYVTITISRQSNNSEIVRYLTQNELFSAGTNLFKAWSGTDFNGNLVSSGTYNFRVEAVDARGATYGSDSDTGTVTVDRSTGQLLVITDSPATPNPFNPSANQVTRIDFSVNMTPSATRVLVYRSSDNAFIRELPIFNLGGNLFRAEWNGRDNNNNIVGNAFYTYRIEVTAGSLFAQKTGNVTVSGTGGGGDDTGVRCGGFTDVPSNHHLCPAIEFVKLKGIFAGYPNGTIGLDKVIQRAELLAVVQKAFRYPLDSYSSTYDGDLGYKDLGVHVNEWFMPYIKTFSRLGLMVGYPDRHMRPDRTMNTAELYLVFLKSAKAAPGNITHFTLKNHELTKFPPFLDTPKTKATEWYLKYAGFAKLNGLVTTERFSPGRGITRGQVIQLVYDTYRKGLITY